VAVLVYGRAEGEEPFFEETQTKVVNAHGGLITLSANVRQGQKLLLTNMSTKQEQECHVVYLGGTQDDAKTEVGIEFTHPAPKFWGVGFPPEDWKRAQ